MTPEQRAFKESQRAAILDAYPDDDTRHWSAAQALQNLGDELDADDEAAPAAVKPRATK